MVTKEQTPKVIRVTSIATFVGKYGHVESIFFLNMESLEVVMKKHNVNIDSSSSSHYSHGHALFSFGFSFNSTSSSSSDEWLINFGASYHMAKD
jgi:hypothetical protein